MSQTLDWTLLSFQPLDCRPFRSVSVCLGPFAPDFAPGLPPICPRLAPDLPPAGLSLRFRAEILRMNDTYIGVAEEVWNIERQNVFHVVDIHGRNQPRVVDTNT